MVTHTIDVDDPWHKTQSFGRISTQALERGRVPQIHGQKPQDTFPAETILYVDCTPARKGR